MSDVWQASDDLAEAWRLLSKISENDRRQIGNWLIVPEHSSCRKGLRNSNIRALANALGDDISIKEKSIRIAQGWKCYIATRWQSHKHLSRLPDDIELEIQWLHACTRFNLGKSLGSRQIENIL